MGRIFVDGYKLNLFITLILFLIFSVFILIEGKHSFTEIIKSPFLYIFSLLIFLSPFFFVFYLFLKNNLYLIFNLKNARNPSASFLLEIADILPKKQRRILQLEAQAMDDEYEEAILFGKPLRAKIIIISYYFGIGLSVVMWISDKIKEIIRVIPRKN